MKYKVMYLITGLNAGGAENMVYKLTKFHSENVCPVVVSILPEGPVSEKIKASGVKLYHLDLKQLRGSFSCFWKLQKIVRNEKPDIIHNFLFHADVFGRLTKLFNPHIKVITSIRNENIGGKRREIFMRYTDFLIDKVTAVCKTAANAQLSAKSIKNDKLNVIYNGVELDHYNNIPEESCILAKQNLNVNQSDLILITVGRLDEQKNHLKLLEIFQELSLQYPKLKLIIVGVGRLEKKLVNIVNQYGLEDKVVFTGHRADIPTLLTISDIFVLSSEWEGLPNVVLEAMAASLPVVSTNVGGAAEVIVDNDTGYLVNKNNTNEFYMKLKNLIDINENERKIIGNKGRVHVEKNFSINKSIEKMERMYNLILLGDNS